MYASNFLLKCAEGNCRIVSSGDLLHCQIVEAQARGNFFVDEATGLGFALLPFELSTEKDKQREFALFQIHQAIAAT